MTEDESDALDDTLDRWEARIRRRWDRQDMKRLHARRERIRDAILMDDPRAHLTSVKPSLSAYDGHQETHGQDF